MCDGPELVVYWRPGCPYCHRLLRWMDRHHVPAERRDIWENPEWAAEVREVTGGDETVPTVVLHGTAMVNPSPGALRTALAGAAPHLLPDAEATAAPWWTRLRPGARGG